VIVDEIHALARDKRGSHLALSLERLKAVAEGAPVRIGLSATVKPVETAAGILVGAGERAPTVVDGGHRRRLDLSLELPDGELEAAIPGDQFEEIVDRIAAHVVGQRTTLVFVNTRKLSERMAHQLGERHTPITFMLRHDLHWLLQAHRGAVAPAEPTAGFSHDVLDALRRHGALFHSELQAMTGSLPADVEEGLRDGVARGLISADGFNAVRSLLNARSRFARRRRPYPRPCSRGRRGTWRNGVEGPWTLLPSAEPVDDADELAEIVARQLLLRWGVVLRDVYLKERLAVPWREILWALRRLEARGLIRGGRFVTGVSGEQFAGQTAMPLLRRRRAD
jgi:hypothetical protein